LKFFFNIFKLNSPNSTNALGNFDFSGIGTSIADLTSTFMLKKKLMLFKGLNIAESYLLGSF
jgi:hypothetical protein